MLEIKDRIRLIHIASEAVRDKQTTLGNIKGAGIHEWGKALTSAYKTLVEVLEEGEKTIELDFESKIQLVEIAADSLKAATYEDDTTDLMSGISIFPQQFKDAYNDLLALVK